MGNHNMPPFRENLINSLQHNLCLCCGLQSYVQTPIQSHFLHLLVWKYEVASQTLFFWAPKSLQMVTTAMKLKDAYSLEGKLMTNLDNILKSRDITFPTKVVQSRLWFFQSSCMAVRVGLWRKLRAKKLMLLNCVVGEDSWESLGLQGDPTSPSWRR